LICIEIREENAVKRKSAILGRGGAVAVAAALTLIVGFFTPPSEAQAVTGAEFNPANVMSDTVMFNGNAMSAAEVQTFLNARVPRCTMGDPGKPAGGIYTFPSGFQTVLANDCLKDYSAAVPSLAADSICAALPGGTISAAEMIYRIGVACNVSQKVLLVLLEKEQSLISDTFPAQVQYNSAVGFNCPDTAPCSAASAGFFKQVYAAARQLQVYGTGSFTWYPVGQVTAVRFHPNGACGASPVLIANRATAALYYYTPYQPNGAALSNLYGTGDACSAYGNRNFWRIYSDWFGSTQEVPGSVEFVRASYADVLGRGPGEPDVNYWVGRIAGGMSAVSMANAFNNSDEYRNFKIKQAYNLALGRDPDPSGGAYWLSVMQAGGLSPEDVYSTFLASDEMFNVQGGGTIPGYVTAMYTSLLGRGPDTGGLNYWSGRLAAGEARRAISDSSWFSPEKYSVRVAEAYAALLARSPGVDETAYWAGVARAGGTTAMRSGIMATQEYWNRAGVRF
jgi:hypothetical protein